MKTQEQVGKLLWDLPGLEAEEYSLLALECLGQAGASVKFIEKLRKLCEEQNLLNPEETA